MLFVIVDCFLGLSSPLQVSVKRDQFRFGGFVSTDPSRVVKGKGEALGQGSFSLFLIFPKSLARILSLSNIYIYSISYSYSISYVCYRIYNGVIFVIVCYLAPPF